MNTREVEMKPTRNYPPGWWFAFVLALSIVFWTVFIAIMLVRYAT